MKKQFISFVVAFILLAGFVPHIPANASAGFTPVTGWDMMARLGVGYTFAMTTEARPWPWDTYTVENNEDAWGQPRIRQWHMESIAMKGFDSYRLCATWTTHMDENYVIDPAFLDRVQEVTDWALAAGLNVMIGTHHEEELYWLIRDNEFAAAERHLNAIWSQVAERFKDYPEGVLFEILNEPNRLEHYQGEGQWIDCNGHDGHDGYHQVCPDLSDMVNRVNASALNVIRNAGGHNAQRVVVLGVPGAQPEAIPQMQIPENDPYIMVGTFGYPSNAINDNSIHFIQSLLDRGIGFVNKEDNTFSDGAGVSYRESPVQLTRTHFTRLAQMGIPSFFFGSCTSTDDVGLLNRITGEWNNTVLRALFEAYGKTVGADYVPYSNFTPIYSLANDSAVQNLSPGASEREIYATPALQSAGNGTVSVVARQGGGNAIQITNRQNNWDSIDIMRAALDIDLSAYDYRITVNGRVINAAPNAEAVMNLGAPDNPWTPIAQTTVTGNGAFTLTTVIGRTYDVFSYNIVDMQQFNNGFRIQGNDANTDFIIDDIIIETDAPSAPTLTPTPTPAPVPASGDVTISLTIGNINATVDGRAIELAAAPFIGDGGRTMIPVRFVADAMGATTDWNAETQTVTITHPSTGAIHLVVGQALPDGMGTPEIVNGRTFVPVRFVAVEMGGAIDWNADTQTVTIVLGG